MGLATIIYVVITATVILGFAVTVTLFYQVSFQSFYLKCIYVSEFG